MQTFAFYLDRTLTRSQLAEVVANVLALPVSSVRAIDQDAFEREPWFWFDEDIQVGLQVAAVRGDFPQEVTVVSREVLDAPQAIGAIAHTLQSTLLTDEFGVNPLIVSTWTMVLPTGEIEQVYIDDEAFAGDDPAIILRPGYRQDFDELHRRAIV